MGFILGGIVVVYLLIRLWQRMLIRVPMLWAMRVAIATLLAFATATLLAGFGLANGGPPVFAEAALLYLIPAAVAFLIETLRQFIASRKVSAESNRA